MTAYAILSSDRARRSASGRGFSVFRACKVARKTLRVVIGWFLYGLFVRIVTCHAAESEVCGVVLWTVEKPVRLKTNGFDILFHTQNLFETYMTRPTKLLRQFERRKLGRVVYLQIFKTSVI